MKNKIAIILTSIARPQALKKSVESIVAQWQDAWVLFVGLQDGIGSEEWEIIAKIIEENPDKSIRLYDLEYDCGISVARNELINKASLGNCSHILLSADSILFNDSMKDLGFIIQEMERKEYSLCGLNLKNRKCNWEGFLTLIPNQSFCLQFINPIEKTKKLLVPVDIVKNFWIAKTEALIQVPYDEQLVACEHEDWFYRYKEAKYTSCCTNFINGMYEKGNNTPEYDKIRANNFRIGQQRLKDKYQINSWITYLNQEYCNEKT